MTGKVEHWVPAEHVHVFRPRMLDDSGKWVKAPSDGSVRVTLVCDCSLTEREWEKERR